MRLRERYIRYYTIHHGYTEIPSKSLKYTLLVKTFENSRKRYIHLGKSGAVRTSKTGNITQSISISDLFDTKQRMELWEKEHYGE